MIIADGVRAAVYRVCDVCVARARDVTKMGLVVASRLMSMCVFVVVCIILYYIYAVLCMVDYNV